MMTQKEAIEYFESLLKRFEEMYETETSYWGKAHAETTIEATRMALSALRPVSREQVERMRGEWQVCFEDWRKQMAGDQCSKCGFQHYGTSTNHYKYCPACGAPMTDEAMQMVMERLEALKDGSTTD